MLYNKSGNSAIQAFAIISLACRTFQWNSFILQVKMNNAVSWNTASWNEKKKHQKTKFSEFTCYEVTCKYTITVKSCAHAIITALAESLITINLGIKWWNET